MDSIVLAARLHGMGGARADIRKAIESWHLSKNYSTGEMVADGPPSAEGARRAQRARQADTPKKTKSNMGNMTPSPLESVMTGEQTPTKQISDSQHQDNLAAANRITGGEDAQGNVNTSSKGVDNPAQSIKDRFDRRQAGNPSMGDTARQGYGNVKEAVGNVGARVGAAGSKALTSAGEAIGNAATAAKDKMGQVGAKASEMGGGMLNAAKRMGQGVYGGIQNAASKVPGMASAAKQKVGEIGAGVMGAAGQAGQAAMGAGRGAMNMASQLPGQVQGAYQGVKHGSQGGANRGGAYLPGVGTRTGNFMAGLKEGGLSGLMEQGLVGTAKAGQQSRTKLGAQQTKNMRRTYDENQQNAKTSNLMGGMKQQAAYGWNPEGQPAPTPGDADGNGVPDVEETQTTSTDGATGEVTQTNETKVTPQAADPASGNSTGGGANAGNIMMPGGWQGGGALENTMNTSGNTPGANMNANAQTMNVNVGGASGGGGAGAGGAGAGAGAGGTGGSNTAQEALAANAQERSKTKGGFGTGVLSNLATGGLSGLMRGGYNAYQRKKGNEQLQAYAQGDYTKAEELASTLAIRQDIEKGLIGDFLSGRRKKEEERTMRFLSDIERGKDWRTNNRTNKPIREPLHRDQYDRELARVVDRASVGDTTDGSSAAMADRIAPRFAPDPQPEPEAAPEEEAAIDRNDIVERSEPWTVVENPFVNPFYSENAFTLRKEPAPQAEVEHSIIDDYIAKDLTPESEIEVSGFDTVEGDDLSLLPASVFAKSNPVGDDMSLLPSGWNADVE